MNSLSVFAADDEPLSLLRLVAMLEAIGGLRLVGTASDGLQALQEIRRLKPDLAVLDIEMPMLNGLDIAGSLNSDACPAIIFVTAYDHYALSAFEANAIDYVTKPVRAERLQKAIARARHAMEHSSAQERIRDLESLVASLRRDKPRDVLGREGCWVTRRMERIFVPYERIEWIEAQGDYVMLHCGEDRFIHNLLLKDMEQALCSAAFCRVHRSAIVRISAIARLKRPSPHGAVQIVMASGQVVPVGRTYTGAIRARLIETSNREKLPPSAKPSPN